jgi:predicted transcriptional regulator
VKRPTREQLVVLGILSIRREGDKDWSRDALRTTGLNCDKAVDKLVEAGLVSRYSDRSYRLTDEGRLALHLEVEGRDCTWCGHRAVGGLRVKGSATRVYFCNGHRVTAERSVDGHVLASKGSLWGLIRAGKIKPRQPDEVAA